ncbi:MAG TPA: DUF2892 domain-containing protein [Ktedonobacterales bacterium]
MIPQNEGALDRVLRFVVGAVFAVLVFTTFTGVWQIVVGVVAAILLVTAVVGFCPLYALFRLNTKGGRRAQA